jgi:hypothetical protein
MSIGILQVLMTLVLWQYLVLRPLLRPIAPLVDYRPQVIDGVTR